jgi:hypothetical protein
MFWRLDISGIKEEIAHAYKLSSKVRIDYDTFAEDAETF